MYHVVDSEGPYYLLRHPKGDRYTVVRKDEKGNGPPDARSVMPGDMPRGGGEWTANWSRSGVDYVASWYSYSWARKVFNRETERNIVKRF